MQQNPGALVKRCIERGGVAVFPADTVYGLACDPEDEEAFTKLNRLKGRSPGKPSAIMFFREEPAIEFVAGLDRRIGEVVAKLIPGPVTLVLPNPGCRYPLACGSDPEKIGLRVPSLGEASSLFGGFDGPVLQTSANTSGEPDPKSIDEVPDGILDQADLVLDGGTLPGTSSTVIDLSRYGADGEYRVLREGALSVEQIDQALKKNAPSF